jgi:putative hydrolase of the HAD superfamily
VGFSRPRAEDESATAVKPPQVRAVTFDVGNTLIEPGVSVGQIYAKFARAHGAGDFSPVELDRRFRDAFRAHGGAVNTRNEWAQIVDTTFAGLVNALPSETFFPQLFDHFSLPSAWHVFEDVAPTLDELARCGVRLGVISNWDSRLRPLLDALGLAKHFEVIVVSCEAGCAKPAREIFEGTAKKFDLSPKEILHVGDSIAVDVESARVAGFCSLQIARGMASGADVIGSLRELRLRISAG